MEEAPPQVGDRARHPNGSVVTWNGSAWVQTAPPNAPRQGGSRGTIPREDSTQLSAMRGDSEAARQREVTYQRVNEANQRLQSGPWRGAFLDAAIPTENDSFLGSIGGVTLGPLARLTGAINPQEVDDYQTMQRARNQGVLAQQLGQRGVQTESDASRMAMADINVRNTPEQNQQVIEQGTQDAIRAQARAAFYSSWASRYGALNALNPQGFNVDAVWNGAQPRIVAHFMEQRRGQQGPRRAAPPTIRRVR